LIKPSFFDIDPPEANEDRSSVRGLARHSLLQLLKGNEALGHHLL